MAGPGGRVLLRHRRQRLRRRRGLLAPWDDPRRARGRHLRRLYHGGLVALDHTSDEHRRTKIVDELRSGSYDGYPRRDVSYGHSYLLHNPFSGETGPLPELDAVHVPPVQNLEPATGREALPVPPTAPPRRHAAACDGRGPCGEPRPHRPQRLRGPLRPAGRGRLPAAAAPPPGRRTSARRRFPPVAAAAGSRACRVPSSPMPTPMATGKEAELQAATCISL